MAIVSVHELPTTGGQTTQSGARNYTRRFVVVVSSVNDGPATVKLATGIPRLYQVYATAAEFDRGAFCINVNAERGEGDGWYKWTVTCDYSTELPKDVTGQMPQPPTGELPGSGTGTRGQDALPISLESVDNPLNQPTKYHWNTQKINVAKLVDRYQEPYVNSAGQQITNVPEETVYVSRLTINRNQTSYDHQLYTQYLGSVNDATFCGYAIGQVLFDEVEAYDNWQVIKSTGVGVHYWTVTFQLLFRDLPESVSLLDNFNLDTAPHDAVAGAWDLLLLDKGFYQQVDVGGGVHQLQLIRDKNGQPISTEVMLDGFGVAANESGRASPVYMLYRQHRKRNWSSLLLP